MKILRICTAFIIGAIMMITGCATQTPIVSKRPFHPVSFPENSYSTAVDNYEIIIDASASMNHSFQGEKKIWIAKQTIRNMLTTLPQIKINSALRSFGHGGCLPGKDTILHVERAPYSRSEMMEGLNAIQCAGGNSPLAKAISGAQADLDPGHGKSALIIVSDGKDVGRQTIEAAQHIVDAMGDRLCMYTILIGDDSEGEKMLTKIAEQSGITDEVGCGYSVSADTLSSSEQMGSFVQSVFLDMNGFPVKKKDSTETVVEEDMDGDGDGVENDHDKCPDTPKGAPVNNAGCWTLKGVNFGTNKWDIKPRYFDALANVARILKNNPGLRVEIQGHTDNKGTVSHNQRLSRHRADSVRKHLIKLGIKASRLTAVGYGKGRPIAVNDTAEGRAKNRRVDIRPIR